MCRSWLAPSFLVRLDQFSHSYDGGFRSREGIEELYFSEWKQRERERVGLSICLFCESRSEWSCSQGLPIGRWEVLRAAASAYKDDI